MLDHADHSVPTHQQELDHMYKIGKRSSLKDRDHEMGIHHTDRALMIDNSTKVILDGFETKHVTG